MSAILLDLIRKAKAGDEVAAEEVRAVLALLCEQDRDLAARERAFRAEWRWGAVVVEPSIRGVVTSVC